MSRSLPSRKSLFSSRLFLNDESLSVRPFLLTIIWEFWMAGVSDGRCIFLRMTSCFLLFLQLYLEFLSHQLYSSFFNSTSMWERYSISPFFFSQNKCETVDWIFIYPCRNNTSSLWLIIIAEKNCAAIILLCWIFKYFRYLINIIVLIFYRQVLVEKARSKYHLNEATL